MDSTIPPALQPIFCRAANAGLKVEPYGNSPQQEAIQENKPFEGLLVHLPNGRETRPFLIKEDVRLHQYSKVPFEQMQFINGLEATWSMSEDVLEAELQGNEIAYNTVFLLKRLKQIFRSIKEHGKNDDSSLWIPYRRNQVQLGFGESTSAFNLLSNYSGSRPKLTIRVSGTRASSHDEARSALYHITDALLFQIKREHNIHLCIRSERGMFTEDRVWGFPNGILTLGS